MWGIGRAERFSRSGGISTALRLRDAPDTSGEEPRDPGAQDGVGTPGYGVYPIEEQEKPQSPSVLPSFASRSGTGNPCRGGDEFTYGGRRLRSKTPSREPFGEHLHQPFPDPLRCQGEEAMKIPPTATSPS
jgi:hypothetical protein